MVPPHLSTKPGLNGTTPPVQASSVNGISTPFMSTRDGSSGIPGTRGSGPNGINTPMQPPPTGVSGGIDGIPEISMGGTPGWGHIRKTNLAEGIAEEALNRGWSSWNPQRGFLPPATPIPEVPDKYGHLPLSRQMRKPRATTSLGAHPRGQGGPGGGLGALEGSRGRGKASTPYSGGSLLLPSRITTAPFGFKPGTKPETQH